MYTDPITGLVDMGARNYDPGTGRFTQPDTVIGALDKPISLNRYLYAHADPLSMFDPDGHWPDWFNDLPGRVGTFLDEATRAVDRAVSSIGNGVASLGGGVVGLGRQVSTYANRAGESIATLAAEASANAGEFWDRHGDRVKSTLAGAAVGAATVGGCVALGIATAGIGGAVCVGAAIGAVLGGAFCDLDQRTVTDCITTGAIAGGVAGLTGGLAASAGASGLVVGSVAGFSGDATEQILATGTIDAPRLVAATVTGGGFGWVGGRLVSRGGDKAISLAGVARGRVPFAGTDPIQNLPPMPRFVQAGPRSVVKSHSSPDRAGEAIVHLDRQAGHASITVRHGTDVLHTEQTGTVGTDAIPAVFRGELSPTTINVPIALPNAMRARSFQDVTLGQSLGRYNLHTRSCKHSAGAL
jgi:RHS repeat-associated protein